MTKVLCFGTFDLFHEGHESYLRQAREHGDNLAVVVARDETVKRVKGKTPKETETERLEKVWDRPYVDEAYLGNLGNPYDIVKEIRPDLICLGYDQKPSIERLTRELNSRDLNIKVKRMEAYKPGIYKTSKILMNSKKERI